MDVKKTKSGKISMTLSINKRNALSGVLMDFISEWPSTPKASSHHDSVFHQLHYATINELVMRKDFGLQSPMEKKIVITVAEAIAIVWELRHYDENMTLLQIKSALHKLILL